MRPRHLRLVELEVGDPPPILVDVGRSRVAWTRVWWWAVAGGACLLVWSAIFGLLRSMRAA